MSAHKPTGAEVLERLIALDGLLNMHERAEKAGVSCKLNGQSRRLDMCVVDCGTAACLHGSARLSPWFKERGYPQNRNYLSNIDDCHKLNGFFGATDSKVSRVYCNSSNSKVRENLRQVILEAGGEQAIQTCEANKKRGDKLRMGIV